VHLSLLALFLVTPQAQLSSLDESFEAMLASSLTPAVSAAAAKDGKVVWARAYGFADVAGGRKADQKTRFGLGSVSKALTTALIARLVDKGLLGWDDPIEKFEPKFPHKGKGVTLKRIASHLSGLGDEFSGRSWIITDHFATTDAALEQILKDTLANEPGTKTFYTTGSYTLLAKAIEHVTGKSFADAMTEHVTGPLEMQDTVPYDLTKPDPARTLFYLGEQGKPAAPVVADPSYKLAGAGYVSTAADMVKFGSALLKPGFLTQRSLDNLFTLAKTKDGATTEFALGWRVGASPGMEMPWIKGRKPGQSPVIHQPGGGPGISSFLVIDRDEKLVVAILANRTGSPVGGDVMNDVFAEFRK
jgi:serine beta-lactamase-like protein LACTB